MLFSHIFPSISTVSKLEDCPLLILHGFLGMSDNWKTLGTQYAERGFIVHTIDLRNHGRSFHSELFNYEVMTQDLFQYCVAQNIQKCYLLGHSMGGKLAMFFAVSYPNLVEKLIVADIAPKYYAPHHEEILNGLQSVDFSTQPSRSTVDAILTKQIPDFNTRQFLLKNLYWQTPGQLAFRFNLPAFIANKDNIGKALPDEAYFSKPTLFLRGGASDYVVQEDFALIKTHFPKSDIQTIPNVGHWLHAENPELFLEKTIMFLT